MRENEQRTRLNNREIQGVPVKSSQNLLSIFSKIGSKINCEISKEQINYIARVPQRNNKNIIVSIHNRYLRDDFVAAAKKCKSLTVTDLGQTGSSKYLWSNFDDFHNFWRSFLVWRRDRNYSYTNQLLGGGVLIAVRRELVANVRTDWWSSAEDIWVTITQRQSRPSKLTDCIYVTLIQNLGLSVLSQLTAYSENSNDIVTNN